MPGFNRLTRRQVLLGAGGITLGLPLLQSVLERDAVAGGAVPTVGRSLAVFWNQHGGISSANMYPALPSSPKTQTYPVLGHSIRQSPLALTSSNGINTISPVISGPATASGSSPAALTPAIVAKMNLIHGLDAGVPLGHNTGGILGNYGGSQTAYDSNVTLDQIIAFSQSFRSQGATVVPVMNYGGGVLSQTWNDPATKSGGVVPGPASNDNLYWFNLIFQSTGSTDAGPPPLSVVDRVYQDYKRLLNGRRISSSDKLVLQAHIAKVQELQAQILQQAAAVASCGHPAAPADSNGDYSSNNAQFYLDQSLQIKQLELQNDVLVLAMACGACRIGINGLSLEDNSTVHSSQYQSSTSDPQAQGLYDWHHGVAHCHMYDLQQGELLTAYNDGFQVFLDLITKMDSQVVAPGTQYETLLDNSLVFWSMECGEYTHQSQSWPVVMAGSAGGALTTGSYLDYRNLSPTAIVPYCNGQGTEVGDILYSGVPYNQWLGTVAQAMGLQQSEYEITAGIGGYGPIQGALPEGGAPVPGAFDQGLYQEIHGSGGWLPFIAGPNATGA